MMMLEDLEQFEESWEHKMRDSDYLGLFGPWLPKKYEESTSDKEFKMKFDNYLTLFKPSMSGHKSDFDYNQYKICQLIIALYFKSISI